MKKAANLVLFVVDASWSMAVAERMAATKGAILSLLTDAYQRRDRVGLVVFQKDRATLILPPTNSTQLAQRALADIPVGGKTPLSAGLLLAHEVIRRETLTASGRHAADHPADRRRRQCLAQRAAPQQEAHAWPSRLRTTTSARWWSTWNMPPSIKAWRRSLAEHFKAPCYTLNELRAETLYQAVRDEMNG